VIRPSIGNGTAKPAGADLQWRNMEPENGLNIAFASNSGLHLRWAFRIGIARGARCRPQHRGTDDHFTRRGTPMKCRLCDRPTTPGTGKLCLDCTKPSTARGQVRPRTQAAGVAARLQEAMATMGVPPTLTPPSVVVPRWRRRGALAAAGVVAIGILYFSQSDPEPRRALDSVVVERAPASSTGRSQIDLSVISTPS
jgi:hypothetical protein